MSSEGLLQIGTLEGHAGGVTALSGRTFTDDADNRVFQLITASRDKTIMLWNIERRGDVASDGQTSVKIVGTPAKSLHGHSHFVSCIDVSNDGQFALSGSWDGTLRLWNLKTGLTTKRFIGHKKDVLSVAFSGGNRQIVSASRDRSIKLWNTRGECKYTLTEEGHTDWVSCVRFSPDEINPTIVSCGWDKMVKVWNVTNCKLKCNLVGHKFYLNTVTVSPDGSLCGSGGKDGVAVLWDLNDGKRLYELDAGDIIHDLVFSPNRYWLCAATESCIKIWDLETKHEVDNLVPTFDKLGAKSIPPHCTSLEWADEGTTLYAGYTDGKVRVWEVSMLS